MTQEFEIIWQHNLHGAIRRHTVLHFSDMTSSLFLPYMYTQSHFQVEVSCSTVNLQHLQCKTSPKLCKHGCHGKQRSLNIMEICYFGISLLLLYCSHHFYYCKWITVSARSRSLQHSTNNKTWILQNLQHSSLKALNKATCFSRVMCFESSNIYILYSV